MIESYTIKWTTPHCVLTLRLIGLVWDVYDGRIKPVSYFYYLECSSVKKLALTVSFPWYFVGRSRPL